MKKIILTALILSFGILFIIGCGQSTTSTTTIPASTAASSVASLAYNSIGIDDTITGLPGVSAEAAIASPASTPVYGADNWWTSSSTVSAGGISLGYYYKFKLWDNSDTEITSLPASSINKISTYSTFEVTSSSAATSFLLSFGASTSNPLIFDDLNLTSTSISGPMSYTSTYSGDSYESTVTYSDVSLSTTGYPDGTTDFYVSYGGSTALTGTVTFVGTNTATVEFSTASGSGTYTVDLDTGDII